MAPSDTPATCTVVMSTLKENTMSLLWDFSYIYKLSKASLQHGQLQKTSVLSLWISYWIEIWLEILFKTLFHSISYSVWLKSNKKTIASKFGKSKTKVSFAQQLCLHSPYCNIYREISLSTSRQPPTIQIKSLTQTYSSEDLWLDSTRERFRLNVSGSGSHWD